MNAGFFSKSVDEVSSSIEQWIGDRSWQGLLTASIILVAGIIFSRLLSRRFRSSDLVQHHMIFHRLVSGSVLVIAVLLALQALGIDTAVLLGTAGVLTVAVGFASQTSASNLISGAFLMFEKPFKVGDLIEVGDTMGYVLNIDVLSVKLRTFDNLLVRIPNETMLKSEVTNLTHFPIRRVDLQLGVAYKEDLDRVQDVLDDVAQKHPMCLDEPAPFFLFNGFGDSALEFQFSAWTTQDNYWILRTELYVAVKRAFDEAGIEIPFPHLSLYTGSATQPFPVHIEKKNPGSDSKQG